MPHRAKIFAEPPTGEGWSAWGKAVEVLFPFSFVVDENLLLLHVGPALQRRFPQFQLGHPLPAITAVKRPRAQWSAALLKTPSSTLYVLEILGSPVELTGQFISVGTSGPWCFVGGPWISSLQAMTASGVKLSDFPPHDPRGDLLLLVQTKETMLKDLAKSNERMRAAESERSRLQTYLDRVQRVDAAAQVSGGLAHNFNNLLALIDGQIEMAQLRLDMGDAPGARERMGHAAAASREAAGLVKQLQNLSADRAIHLETVNILEEVRQAQALVQPALGERISWETSGAGGAAVYVRCDRGALSEILVNLALNAAEAMGGAGRISVKVQADGTPLAHRLGVPRSASGLVGLSFSDDGPGISEDVADQIFRPFFTTKGEVHTGLGLATVERLASLCEGFVVLGESELGGATFQLFFRTEEPQSVSPRRVLVVDDDEAVLDLIGELLMHSGYAVERFSDPSAAVKASTTPGHAFDAIVSDVRMPGMLGPEMVEKIEEKLGPVPTVFITGFAGGVFATERALPGYHTVLPKPFQIAQLTGCIERVVSASAARSGAS